MKALGKSVVRAKTGIGRTTLDKMIGNKSNPTAGNLAKIQAVTGVDGHWLLTGEGKPYGRTRPITVEIGLVTLRRWSDHLQRDLDNLNILGIPLLSDPIKAGTPRAINQEDVAEVAVIHRAWCPNPETTWALRVKGDSMEPAIPDGSVVTVDTSQAEPAELNGQMAAVLYDGDCTVKRIQLSAGSRIVCMPDNLTSNNRPLVLENFRGDKVIGRVVSVHTHIKAGSTGSRP